MLHILSIYLWGIMLYNIAVLKIPILSRVVKGSEFASLVANFSLEFPDIRLMCAHTTFEVHLFRAHLLAFALGSILFFGVGRQMRSKVPRVISQLSS